MMTIGVYTLTDRFTGKFYVGSSQNVENRLKEHMSALHCGYHANVNLQTLWNSGRVALLENVFPTETREEAFLLEQDFIDRFKDSDLLLNIGLGTFGGDNLSRHPNREEIVKKLKDGLAAYLGGLTPLERKLLHSQPGAKNGMWGRTHTAEARAKVAEANRGNQYCLGKKASDEARRKISEFAKTRTGEKNPFFGKTHSEETKAKWKGRNAGVVPANAMRVKIGDEVYSSATEAARHLDLSVGTIINRIRNRSGRYGEYSYVT
jgi:group I intron endonuclease